jgi:hypothetical protein
VGSPLKEDIVFCKTKPFVCLEDHCRDRIFYISFLFSYNLEKRYKFSNVIKLAILDRN